MRPIVFDRTGFQGQNPNPYRWDAWEFLLSGGGGYCLTDHSFSVRDPRGTAAVSPPSPGTGGPEIRRQLSLLRQFLARFDTLRLRPGRHLVTAAGAGVCALARPGEAYALYLRGQGPAEVSLDAPPGHYRYSWIDPATGDPVDAGELVHQSGRLLLTTPPFKTDLACRLIRGGVTVFNGGRAPQ